MSELDDKSFYLRKRSERKSLLVRETKGEQEKRLRELIKVLTKKKNKKEKKERPYKQRNSYGRIGRRAGNEYQGGD